MTSFHLSTTSYFSYEYNLDTAASSAASAVPFAVAAASCAAAGAAADALVARGVPLTRVRKLMQTIATLGPAAALLALAEGGSALPCAAPHRTAAPPRHAPTRRHRLQGPRPPTELPSPSPAPPSS